MIANFLKPFSAIGVSETWLSDQNFNFIDIPGYHFISNHRKNKTGGGTDLYLQDHYEYKLLSDCTISDPDTLESLFVEINNPSGKNIIVGTVYRPPNQNLSEFFDKFFVILSIISKELITNIRAVYTRENKPRLTLAAAYVSREHPV